MSAEQAVAAVQVLGSQVNAQYPDVRGGMVADRARPWGATAVALNDERVDPLIRRSVLLMLAAVAALLLIVCVNLANLTLVEASRVNGSSRFALRSAQIVFESSGS